MSIENDSSARRLEAGANPKRRCLFISGFGGSYAGIRGIEEELEKAYGGEKVKVFNSIYSSDPKNPQRFNQMAKFIMSHAAEGLDVVALSLGAAELRKAIRVIKKKKKDFFNDSKNFKNLHIILVSPSGFNKSRREYLKRSLKYFSQEGELPVISKPNELLRGISALLAFPLIDVPVNEFTKSLRKAVPELSQYGEDAAEIPLEEEKGYVSYLDPIQQADVKKFSERFRVQMEKKDYALMRKLIAEYGEMLRQSLARVFAGEFENKKEREVLKRSILESMWGSMRGQIRMFNMLINATGSTSLEEFSKLQEEGVLIDFIIPEYDVFMKINEAVRVVGRPRVKMAGGAIHSYFALRKEQTARMVRDIGRSA